MNDSDKKQSINIQYLVRFFLSHWLLILISMVLFLTMAMFYFTYASRTYKVFSRVIIRTDQPSANRGSSAYVNVSDLMNQEKSFTNEIAYLRSSPLIEEVIKDMNLTVSYFIKEDKIPRQLSFGFINIYKKSPFIVVMNDDSQQPLNTLFYFNIIDNESFVISAQSNQAYLYDPRTENVADYPMFFYFDGIYKFGEQIGNEFCSFKILLNSNYNESQYRGKDLFFKFNSPKLLAIEYRENLEVNSAFFESSIADLVFEGDNLELSKDFLTNLIDKYIDKNLEKKNSDANNTIRYINNQLEIMSGSLGQSERQLQNFRANRDVMNIDEKTSSIYGQLQQLRETRDNLEIQYQNLTQINDYLEANKDSQDFIAPSLGISDPTLATLIQELTTLISERQSLISTNQIRSPRLRTLEINIENINKVISDNLKFNISSIQNELRDIERRIRAQESEFSSLPTTQRQLTGLEREFSINNQVYTSLLDKRIQAQIAKASNKSDCEIIEPVRFMEIASPSFKKIFAIALFLGLLIPSIYIMIRFFLSNKIRTKEELKMMTSLPIAGSIPHVKKSIPDIILKEPQSFISENFNSLKSNIVYYLMGEKNKIILVTSTIPNEGKTFISSNLAVSFASTNNKTVYVGFDLRKTNHVFNDIELNAEKGLSTYLINKSSIDEIIYHTNIDGLDYIPNGLIPPNPVALISTSKTRELLDYLKSNYDYVIVDTPPYGLVADSFLLLNHADLSVYVTRFGLITKRALKQTLDDIREKNIQNLYLVHNDISKIDKSYTEKYAYSYNQEKRGLLMFFKRLFTRKRKKK